MRSLFVVFALTLPLAAFEKPAPQQAMKIAAEEFLKTLDADQRKQAEFPMADASRENFRFTPRDRTGACIKEMTPKQRAAAMDLLKSALNKKGYMKANQIMALEGVLAKMENRPEFRDPEKYFVSVFGKPGDPKGWGWKYEGHHLSLNYTIVGDEISVTPSFFGSNPAKVPEGEMKGLRVLKDEEDLAIALAKDLVAAGKKEVVFTDETPDEILTREERKASALKPVGLPVTKMSDGEKAKLLELIRVYVDRHRPALADADMASIEKAGIDNITFGWSGAMEPGKVWYYRIQGPTFVMEAANSQNGANHVHATWREFDGDFGRDVLGEHYKDGHHKH